jgi:hypothetical protein
MKISEAIEAGWQRYEQCRGPFYRFKSGHVKAVLLDGVDAVCALGAASIAVEPDELPSREIVQRHWPELTEKLVPGTPMHQLVNTSANFGPAWDQGDAISYINDFLEYSKEEVVETVRSWGL